MKRIAVFIILNFLFLLMISCASAPNWSVAETEAGEFILAQSSGIRFYFNVIILGFFIILFTASIFIKPKESKGSDKLGWDHIGCLGVIFLLLVVMLWSNIKQNILKESISLNSERLMKTHYPDSILKTDVLEWKNITSCDYFSGEFGVVHSRMVVGGTQWKTGDNLRSVTLTDQNKKQVTLVIEKDEFDTHWMNYFKEWIFGSNDFAFSPEDEARLKKTLNKHLPENVKAKMSAQTKEYLLKQE